MKYNTHEEVAANNVGTGAAVSLPPSVEPPGISAMKKRNIKEKKCVKNIFMSLVEK